MKISVTPNSENTIATLNMVAIEKPELVFLIL